MSVFKQQFSVFKQHFTYFNTLFHPHVFPQKFSNNNFQFLNTCTKRALNDYKSNFVSDRFRNFVKGVIKKILIKRELEYIKLSTKKKKVLQFPSTIFQILICYMIVHYEYLLPMWIVMTILFC